jgi:hypothetical protein
MLADWFSGTSDDQCNIVFSIKGKTTESKTNVGRGKIWKLLLTV